jgi:hypothetical protein
MHQGEETQGGGTTTAPVQGQRFITAILSAYPSAESSLHPR